jgi:hypothetical protein
VHELHPYRVGGMVTRTSTRWFRHWPSERRYRSVPYVTETGKFSSLELVTWNCYPEQLVASLTSTVYTRLLKIWMKRKQRFRDIKWSDKKILFKVAALYVTTHSDYFLDRALALLHRPGPLNSIVNCFVRKLDDKFWFVYSQICNQIYWLTFQSLGISDKSRKDFCESLMPEGTQEARNNSVKSSFETASCCNNRIMFRKTPYVRVSKLRDRIKDPIVLAFFEDWSEPELDSD